MQLKMAWRSDHAKRDQTSFNVCVPPPCEALQNASARNALRPRNHRDRAGIRQSLMHLLAEPAVISLAVARGVPWGLYFGPAYSEADGHDPERNCTGRSALGVSSPRGRKRP